MVHKNGFAIPATVLMYQLRHSLLELGGEIQTRIKACQPSCAGRLS